MKKLSIVLMAVAMMAAMPANAKVTKEYQRPSLHMVLLNTDEPTSEAVADLLPVVNDSWTDYEFPHLYNQFTIPTAVVDGGKPKGNMVELITRYGDAEKLKTMTMEEITELQSLMAGKQYNADLQARCDSMANEVAHQLIARWFNITPDGKYDCDTIFYYACYSAQQVAAADAAANTEMGAQLTLFNELMEPTIANTYVSFSKLAFYDNEPIAAFVRDLAIAAGFIADQAGAGGYASLAATAAAKIAYEATKNGYSAYTTTLLYRLAWNDSIYNEFSKVLKPTDESNPWTGTVDMAAFNAMNFNLELMGIDRCNTVTFPKKDQDDVQLTRRAVHANINKQLVRLQNKYEEFKPMVPILDKQAKFLIADMGTKESVKEGETFNVIQGKTNANGVTKYSVIGQVKVQKKGVWDNEVNMAEQADNAAFEGGAMEIQGTKLAGPGLKMAEVGMFVKRARAKKQ